MVRVHQFMTVIRPEDTVEFKRRKQAYDEYTNQFSLEEVPKELHSFILEKMSYHDFATFSQCNSFTAEMCNSLPNCIKPQIQIDQMFVVKEVRNKDGEEYFLDKPEILEKCFPKHVHYKCSEMWIDPQYWNVIKDHRITVTLVRVLSVPRVSAEFVQKLLQLTKATELDCYAVEKDVLELPEMKQLKEINLGCPIDDDSILNLQVPVITITNWSVPLPLLKRFLKQWICGKRKLKWLKLDQMPKETVASLCHDMGQEKSIQINLDLHETFFICKDPNHKACLSVSNSSSGFMALVTSHVFFDLKNSPFKKYCKSNVHT